jgi:cytochrome P450
MKKIPSRKRIPVLTDLVEFPQMMANPIGYCEGMVEKYGDVCYVPLPGVKNYFVHDPEIIKEILVTQSDKFIKSRLYIAMKRFLGEGLLTSEGSFHKQQRKLSAPAFHKQRIHEYADTMVRCTHDEIKNWKEGDVVNVNQAMTNITLQIVTNTLFGSYIEPGVLKKVSETVSELLETATTIFANPFYLICFEKNISIPIVKKLYSVKKQIDEIILNIIAAYRKSGADKNDLLTMLLTSRDEETGVGMDNQQIRDEVITMFLAGHETTTTALSWTWYLLGKHPAIEKMFYQEIAEKIENRTPTAADYSNLVLTRNIFKETLRLYPPSWTFAREANQDVDIQGYHFPKGSVVSSLMYIMHRNGNYFKNPNEFMPQRWDDTEEVKALPRFAYFPFGGGNRMCIGEGFAWMEAVLILATVASRFQLVLPENFNTTINASFTLRTKDPISMMVKRNEV